MTRLSRQRTAIRQRVEAERLPRAQAHLRAMQAAAPTAGEDCEILNRSNGHYLAVSARNHPVSIGVEGDTIEQARRFFAAAFEKWVELAERAVTEAEGIQNAAAQEVKTP